MLLFLLLSWTKSISNETKTKRLLISTTELVAAIFYNIDSKFACCLIIAIEFQVKQDSLIFFTLNMEKEVSPWRKWSVPNCMTMMPSLRWPYAFSQCDAIFLRQTNCDVRSISDTCDTTGWSRLFRTLVLIFFSKRLQKLRKMH